MLFLQICNFVNFQFLEKLSKFTSVLFYFSRNSCLIMHFTCDNYEKTNNNNKKKSYRKFAAFGFNKRNKTLTVNMRSTNKLAYNISIELILTK